MPTADSGTVGLTARGAAQAETFAAALTETPALVAISPYLRARRTAEPTLRRFPQVPHEEWDVHEFTYLGSLHGRLLRDVERAPYAAEYWSRADPYAVDRPEAGAESFAGLLARVDRFLAQVERAPAGLVTVFTHGMFIRAVDWFLRARAGTVDLFDMAGYRAHHRQNPVPNASVTVLGPGPCVSAPIVPPAVAAMTIPTPVDADSLDRPAAAGAASGS